MFMELVPMGMKDVASPEMGQHATGTFWNSLICLPDFLNLSVFVFLQIIVAALDYLVFVVSDPMIQD